jgi:hypothetical protein
VARPVIDRTGQRFGLLTVVARAADYVSPSGRGHGQTRWLTRCDCGVEKVVLTNNLRRAKSCGCHLLTPERREQMRALGLASRQAMVGYTGAHERVRRIHGSASRYVCPCGQPAKDWAYNHQDPNEVRGEVTTRDKVTELAWSLDPAFYDALCRSCHRARDGMATA